MTKYQIMFEALQEKVNSGELTFEDADALNKIAFEKYGDDETEYVESCSDEEEGMTHEEYLESMETELFGEATRLAKVIHKKATDKNSTLDERLQNRAIDSIAEGDRVKAQMKNLKKLDEERQDAYANYKSLENKANNSKSKSHNPIKRQIQKSKLQNKSSDAEKDFYDKQQKYFQKKQNIEKYQIKAAGDVKSAQLSAYNAHPSKKSLEKKDSGTVLKAQRDRDKLMGDYSKNW